MIALNTYFKKFERNDELFDELRAQRFLKTEMDVVYDDFVRWENSGLLFEVSKDDKHLQRRYSYVDYTWVKVVEQLRCFGFDYEMIKSFRNYLGMKFDNDFFIAAIKEKWEELLKYSSEEELESQLEELTNSEDNQSDAIFFEGLIINAINYNDTVSLLFFHDKPNFCFPLSSEIYKEFENQPKGSEYLELLNQSHASISINGIIEQFVTNDLTGETKSKKFKSILSAKERQLLKIIRKNYKDLKRIKIKYRSNEMDLLEVTTTKKTNAESKILRTFNKGTYESVRLEAVDGTIVYYENTQKYKL